VRDEVLTLLLAGHETTANALCWTFVLLAQHPHMEATLREEYQRVLNGRPPLIEDLPQLSFTRMVIEEAMRLYPPAWAFGRHALQEDEIGGYAVPNGAYVLLFPYVTHRHPAFWERPGEFDPERFSPERAAGRLRFAYSPLEEAHACVLATSLLSPKHSSSWRRSCHTISYDSCLGRS
jgi:cytochrome P450